MDGSGGDDVSVPTLAHGSSATRHHGAGTTRIPELGGRGPARQGPCGKTSQPPRRLAVVARQRCCSGLRGGSWCPQGALVPCSVPREARDPASGPPLGPSTGTALTMACQASALLADRLGPLTRRRRHQIGCAPARRCISQETRALVSERVLGAHV